MLNTILPVLIGPGLVGALLLMLVSITIARIAIADDILLVGALGFSGICSLVFTIAYFIWWAEPIVWWEDLLTAGTGAMTLFSTILLIPMARAISLIPYSPDTPRTVSAEFPGWRVIITLLIVAATLVFVDSFTGSGGWGWFIGIPVFVVGVAYGSAAPIFRYYLGQRLADIDDFEPELLVRLEQGRVSRHVLGVIRHWTETEAATE